MKRPLVDRVVIKVFKDKELVCTGNVYDAREYIEKLLEEKLGFFVSLQESFEREDKEYFVYLHTDAYEDLEDEELDQVFDLGISEDNIASTKAIKSIFGLDIKFSHYLD